MYYSQSDRVYCSKSEKALRSVCTIVSATKFIIGKITECNIVNVVKV